MMSNILMNELSLDLQRVFVSNRSSRNYDVLIKNTDSIEKVIIYDWELIVGAFFKKQRNMVIYRLTSPCIIVFGWPIAASCNILMNEQKIFTFTEFLFQIGHLESTMTRIWLKILI